MNTKDLIDATYYTDGSGLTKVKVTEIVKDFLEGVRLSLLDGETVHLSGIGRLVPHTRPARNGRNPKTGETLHISARTFVKLNPTDELRNL